MKPQTVVIMVVIGVPVAWALWRAIPQLMALRGKEADLRRREEELADLSIRLSAASAKAVEELDRRKRELAELISLCDERLAELRHQSFGRKVVRLDQAAATPPKVAVPATPVPAPALAATSPVATRAMPPAAAATAPPAAMEVSEPAASQRGPGRDVLARHRLICDLADQGLDLAEVARRTHATQSEVELVLALRDADRELSQAGAETPVVTRRATRKGGARS